MTSRQTFTQSDHYVGEDEDFSVSARSERGGYLVRIGSGPEPAVRLWFTTEGFERFRAAIAIAPPPTPKLRTAAPALALIEGVAARSVGRIS